MSGLVFTNVWDFLSCKLGVFGAFQLRNPQLKDPHWIKSCPASAARTGTDRSAETLAPYAQFSADSCGRNYAEIVPAGLAYRIRPARSRSGVIISRAFRRLEYKTQFLLNVPAIHSRTRLTHTIEVAAITRNICRALKLNEDLGETIALARASSAIRLSAIRARMVLNRLMKNTAASSMNRRHSLAPLRRSSSRNTALFPA